MAFILLAAPFFINDLGFIALQSTNIFYIFDYAVRIAVLLVCVSWSVSRAILAATHREAIDPTPALLVIGGLVVAHRFIFHFVHVPLDHLFPLQPYFQFPLVTNGPLYILDLTFGLFLVAVSEEVVFRKLLLNFLESFLASPAAITILAGGIFGAMHWASGLANVCAASLYGALSMWVYMRIGLLWPLIAAHWLANVIAFS